MDAKDLKTDLAVGARNDGSNKYGQGSITCDRNKPYQEVGSNSLGKVDVQTSRPCAVIGPDRVVAPVAADVYLKKPPDQWLHPEHPYRRPPDYPLKMTDFQSPTRNISPRQTFQENMQRIMVPPTYNSLKLNSDSALSDTNVPLPKNKLNVSTDPKYCEVPYNISPLTGEPKSYKNVDISVSIGNPTVNQSAPYLWPATSVQQSRPYGASEFYPYADYSGCSGVRTMPNSRPHRLLSEETSSTYPERYFADSNVRFKPYPTIKEGYPQQRYECMSNYSNSYHPPPYPPPRYDLQKPVVPHMYSSYPQVPVKYIDNRMAEPAVDGFQRSNPPPNYSVAFHNQFIHPAYGPVPGNCVQNKMFSYPPEVSVKQNHMTKLAYENNKVYSDFDSRNKNYGIPEHYYGNDMIRAHSSKGQVMLSKHPPPNSAIPGHAYYRNPQFRNYDHNVQLKNTDYSLNMTSPIMRFTPHFSPNSSSMSPLESSSIHSTIQDENIYLGQKPLGSMRNADMRRIKTDMYGRFGTGLHRNSAIYGDHKASNSSKDKKNIDVRQFLQQWNDDDENYDSSSSKQENIQNSNEKNQTGQNIKNQDQLYVLGLVNVPSEELSKYEHIQKISKLPDNIKGYNSLELLNQFEEAIEISNLNSNASATAKMCDVQAPMKQLPIQRATVPPQPRPVSPLDVEAKISQSVIHKEVGCNFEIKPCSPKMLNADVAAPVQTILDERVIEKLTNPHGIKSPISKPSNNIISFSIPKNEDNQINLMHQKLKNPSCKLTNQFNSDEFIQPNKGNYSLNDLEGSSGVCLASLPRLDNEIEFNFPEVNQQFIDANKPESLISSTTGLDPKSDSDYQRLKMSSPLKEHSLSSHLNADSSSYPKLSKYRKVKKVDNDSPLEVHFPVQAMRTDSVIIKNETAKESNVNTGFEKLLENTSSSKYEEIRQHTSSPAISIKSEEKEELIESLFEKEEISNDVIDFSVNKNNSSSTNTNNENNDNDFEVGLGDTSSTQKCSEISVQKSFDILISDIYSRRTSDKLYKNVMSPVNSNNDDNVVNPLVNDDLNTKSEMFSKTIKREQKKYDETVDKSVINISSQSDISQYLIEKQIPDREIKTNLEASCYSTEKDESAQEHLSECDRNTEPKKMCLNMEVKVRNIDIEHSCNTSSETNSTYENNGFLVPMPTPSRSPIPDDPKASDTENNLSWFRKEKSLEVVTIDYIGTSIHMHESGSLSRHDESLNVDNLPLKNKDILKTNNNEMVLKEQSCKTENSYQDDPIFNISENYCETLGQCIESKNLEFEKKDSNEMCAVRNKCDEISVLYSDMDMDLNDSQLSNKPIMEEISEEEVDICNSDTSVIAKRYINKGIDEICIVKACDKVTVSNSYTNENSAEVNRTGNKQVIVENNHSEIGVPSSNSNIDVSLSTTSDEVMDIGRDETYVSNNNTKAEASNIIENGSDHKSFDLVSESKCDTNTTEFDKNYRNQPMIVENHCEDIDVSRSDTNVNASGLHINKCDRATVKKAEETCTIESTAQKTNESCELIENTLGVENHHSSISLNTTMHTKLNHLHPENFQNNDTIKSSDKKNSRADNNEHIVFQDSGNISDYKLTSKVHKDFVEVQNFDDSISLEKDYKSKERLQSLQTELEHEIVNVKNEDKNMLLHESSPSSSTRNNNQSTLQKIFQYRKVCDKPVPIKQYSPWIQKLILFHEGIFPLPMISCCSDQNNEIKKCRLLLNNVDPNITPAEESMEISVNDVVQEEKTQFPQFSVLTLKDIASRVLQNCSEKSGIDDANKTSPENSVLNLPSDKLHCKTYTPKPPSSLKRSLSDSALNIFDDQSCATDHLWPKRRKPEKDSIQKKLLAENYCQLLQNQRRNSISTIFNEDISICILLDDNCIITEEGEEIDQNYVEEAKSDSVHDKLFEDFNNISKLDNQKFNDDILELEEKPTESCWIEDVACVETVVSDNIEDNEAGIDYTKEENYVDMVSLPNNDACVETDVSDNNEENEVGIDYTKEANEVDMVSLLNNHACVEADGSDNNEKLEVGIDYTKEANEVDMVSLPNNHACVEADGSDNNEENEVGIDYTEEANYVETNSDACAEADISDNIEDNKVGFDYRKEKNYVDMVSFPNNDAHIKPDISDNIEENEMGTNYSKEENFVDMVSLPNSDACVETNVSDNIEEDEIGTNYSKEENYVDMVSLPNSDACVETDVSDNTEDTEVGIDYSKEENYVDIVSLPNNDAIPKYDFEYKEESAINLTCVVKSINYDNHSEVLINTPCQVSPMDYNIINTEDADRQTLENILTGTDSIKTINNDFDVLDANTTISRDIKRVPINKPFIDTIKGKDNVSLIDKECNKKNKIDSAQPTQYDIIHSCESSIDNVFTYENKEDITRYSTSPEVSSTTSEDRCSSILLKITNYQGSITSELSNSNDTRRISCKYTENNDYNKSNNKSSSNRPLITKAAQKYIPPLSESIPDLKVKLPLSPHSLLKFKDLKMAKEFPKLDPKLQKRTNIDPSLPKKVKPKFEDVLKSIDEIQIKMHKEKSKKIKKSIPKVVIKKSENGSHYTSSQNNELSDPDLTGRKWQPWVFIERNKLVDNMVTKKKTKAIFSHRKNEFVLKDTFRKYKSVSSAKFVISQPRVDKLSKGQLKYTIKLKHSY